MKKLSMIDTGFLLTETRETPMHVGGVSLYTLPDGADELFEELRSLRMQLARERDVPAYIVFNDATLREMAATMPSASVRPSE